MLIAAFYNCMDKAATKGKVSWVQSISFGLIFSAVVFYCGFACAPFTPPATVEVSQASTQQAPTATPKPTPKPTPRPTAKPAKQVTVTVYVTRTGSKYHKDGCSYLKSKISMELNEAIRLGYEPCSRCY